MLLKSEFGNHSQTDVKINKFLADKAVELRGKNQKLSDFKYLSLLSFILSYKMHLKSEAISVMSLSDSNSLNLLNCLMPSNQILLLSSDYQHIKGI
jgi:hypothetical protein